MVVLRDAGSSASGTAGTKVAEITAASGKKIVQWWVGAGQTNTANTQFRTIITYTDDTTTTLDTAAATATAVMGNAGALIRRVAAAIDNLTALSDKAVRAVRVETLGTGTGTRYAAISGIEVAI